LALNCIQQPLQHRWLHRDHADEGKRVERYLSVDDAKRTASVAADQEERIVPHLEIGVGVRQCQADIDL
jgi:hypothetical protein